ncbi:hypothetical protein [Carnobacterium maltaromaticum]|nr:hypothetical protein [Carnobacterium maltaromaticum]
MKNKKILVGVLFMSLLVLASCGPQKGASVESSNIENKSEKKRRTFGLQKSRRVGF